MKNLILTLIFVCFASFAYADCTNDGTGASVVFDADTNGATGAEVCVGGNQDVSGALTVGGVNVCLQSRTLTGGTGIKIAGSDSAQDLSANRTITVDSTEAGFLTDNGTTGLTCGSSNQGKVVVLDDGRLQYCDGATTSVVRTGPVVLFTTSSDGTVVNTTTEGTILGTVQGSSTIPTAWLNRVGATFRVNVGGTFGTNTSGTNNITVKVKLGSTTVLSRGPGTLTNTVAGGFMEVVGTVTTRTTGASGTVYGYGTLKSDPGGFQLGPNEWAFVNTAQPVTVDLTSDKVLDVTATWNNASTLNTITGSVVVVELLN